MRKPKIAVIGLKGLPAYGGAATVGENIIEQLKYKYDFIVYATASHTDYDSGEYNGYKQIVWPDFLPGKLNIIYYYLISTLHCFLKKYDAIHLHHNVTGTINLFLRIKYKTIYTSHSTEVRENFKSISKIINYSEYLAVKYSNIATAVAKRTYEKFKKIRSKNVEYIPNGVNEIDIDNLSKIRDKYIMFAAGRILPSKGLHILLKSMDELNATFKLKVAGDMEYSPDYKKGIKELSKDLNIELLGLIKNKNRLFSYVNKADFFVFPSSIEAMSMMLLEVASVKTPLICSDIQENKDLFNEKEVLFFEVDNYGDLASKIKWAIANPQEMNKMSELAYKKVKTNYLWKDIANRYDKLYRRVV